MTGGALAGFLEASVRTATPLAYAALGEMMVERSGVINVGLEGAIIAGAFGAMVASGYGGVLAGFAGATIAGVMVSAIFMFFVVVVRADQIIAGTAISMFGLGLTGMLYRVAYGSGGAALHTPTTGLTVIPILSRLPVVGMAFFAQPVSTYALYFVVPLLTFWMYRTTAGLALRAVGEHPGAAAAVGISPARTRALVILFGGAMGGMSGGTLVLSQVGTFAEGMSAGRGFIAIAIVVLGRWTPLGVAGAALLFGGASALQYLSQAMDWHVPYQASLALPYILTLIALATAGSRSSAPAALGER